MPTVPCVVAGVWRRCSQPAALPPRGLYDLAHRQRTSERCAEARTTACALSGLDIAVVSPTALVQEAVQYLFGEVTAAALSPAQGSRVVGCRSGIAPGRMPVMHASGGTGEGDDAIRRSHCCDQVAVTAATYDAVLSHFPPTDAAFAQHGGNAAVASKGPVVTRFDATTRSRSAFRR